MIRDTYSLLELRRSLIITASTLNDSESVGSEYVRGQAELIAYSTLTRAEADSDMIQGGDLLDRIYNAIHETTSNNIDIACDFE